MVKCIQVALYYIMHGLVYMEILQAEIATYIHHNYEIISIGIETTMCLIGTSFYTLQVLIIHNNIHTKQILQ